MKRASALMILLSMLGCTKAIVCPDGRTVTLQPCQPAQLVSRRVVLAAKVNLEYSGKKLADVDAALATDAQQLTSLLTNRTVQLESLLFSFCQSGNADPCKLSERVLDAKLETNKLLQTTKEQTDEIKIVSDKIAATSDSEERKKLIETLHELTKKTADTIETPLEVEKKNPEGNR